MANMKVKTLTVVNHNPVGSELEFDENTAKWLESYGHAEIVGKVSAKPAKKKSESKKDEPKDEPKTEESGE